MKQYVVIWEKDGDRNSCVVEARDETHARSLVPDAPSDAEITTDEVGTGVGTELLPSDDPGTQQYPGYIFDPITDTWKRDDS